MKLPALIPCLLAAIGLVSCKKKDVPPPPPPPVSEKAVSLEPAETPAGRSADAEAPKEGLPKPPQEDFKAATPAKDAAPEAGFDVQTRPTDDATREALDKLLEKTPTVSPGKP